MKEIIRIKSFPRKVLESKIINTLLIKLQSQIALDNSTDLKSSHGKMNGIVIIANSTNKQ